MDEYFHKIGVNYLYNEYIISTRFYQKIQFENRWYDHLKFQLTEMNAYIKFLLHPSTSCLNFSLKFCENGLLIIEIISTKFRKKNSFVYPFKLTPLKKIRNNGEKPNMVTYTLQIAFFFLSEICTFQFSNKRYRSSDRSFK